MDNATIPEASATTITSFGAKDLLANARIYKAHKRIMDAASAYDSLDDAIAGLRRVWEAFETQERIGAEYTPGAELGFGSDNGTIIAAKVLGRGTTVGSVRKALVNMGG